MRRGEVWLIKGARERLGLIISSDVFNGTDVPVGYRAPQVRTRLVEV